MNFHMSNSSRQDLKTAPFPPNLATRVSRNALRSPPSPAAAIDVAMAPSPPQQASPGVQSLYNIAGPARLHSQRAHQLQLPARANSIVLVHCSECAVKAARGEAEEMATRHDLRANGSTLVATAWTKIERCGSLQDHLGSVRAAVSPPLHVGFGRAGHNHGVRAGTGTGAGIGMGGKGGHNHQHHTDYGHHTDAKIPVGHVPNLAHTAY